MLNSQLPRSHMQAVLSAPALFTHHDVKLDLQDKQVRREIGACSPSVSRHALQHPWSALDGVQHGTCLWQHRNGVTSMPTRRWNRSFVVASSRKR